MKGFLGKKIFKKYSVGYLKKGRFFSIYYESTFILVVLFEIFLFMGVIDAPRFSPSF
jgi:hypothetical protein